MALVVEDGTGKNNAESFVSVADADTYHAGRGNAAWAALALERKEQLLRIATDYMGGAYGLNWQGCRAVPGQALDWPRAGVTAFEETVPRDDVPAAVQNACAILALKAQSGPLAPDLGPRVKRSKVGPIETEYDDYSPQSKRYISVDRMLSPYLAARRFSAPLYRA